MAQTKDEENVTKDGTNIDAIEHVLGCGLFQGLLFLCFQFICFLLCMNVILMAFAKTEPSEWSCGGENASLEIKCQEIDYEKCNNFTSSSQFYSIVQEWQLLCSRTKYVYLIMTLQMLGSLFGSLAFSQMSDMVGRQWALFVSTLAVIATGLGSAFSPNWQIFAALRFVNGFACGGALAISFVYSVEFLELRYRNAFLNAGGWSIMYVVFGVMGYILPHWKTFTIVTNCVGIPILGLAWIIGETPRWLIQRGRLEEARRQLRWMAKLNLARPDKDKIELALKLPKPETATKRYALWHLCYSRKLVVITVVLDISYFCVSLVFLASTFSMDTLTLTGNMFVNFIIMSFFRFIACNVVVAADFFIKGFGRKIGFCGPFAIMAALCIAVMSVQIAEPNSSKMVIDILAVIIAIVAQPLWIMVWLSNGELYPTPIRNAAVGFNVLFEYIGAAVAPQTLYLGRLWIAAPYLIYAVLSVIAAVLFGVFIPETKGKPLPETMPERKRKDSVFVMAQAPQKLLDIPLR